MRITAQVSASPRFLPFVRCRAHSGGRALSGDDSVQVEADPVAQFAVFERITGEGLQVVGWYHSHPLFEPSPSVRDTQNQLSQVC